MAYGLAADAVVLLHGAFLLFVVFGVALVWRWPRVAWFHVPALIWGILVVMMGWTCPLTPLEQHLRQLAGQAVYEGGFINHYLTPLVLSQPPGTALRWFTVLLLGCCHVAVYWRMVKRAGVD